MFIGGQIMKFPVYLVIILVLTMAPPLHADQGSSAGGGSMGQPMKRLTPE